jgi:hypothetical protein
MKRNILLVAFLSAVMSVAFITEAWAAATLVTSKTEKQVGANTRYTYVVADTVETGTPEVFKIPVLKTAGKIDEGSFVSTSPDVRVWCNGLDGQSFTDQPVFDWTIDTLSFSPEMKARDYVNMDTVQDKFLYFTITNNSATATGTWTLTLDFIRN